jgi:hypothetical protein
MKDGGIFKMWYTGHNEAVGDNPPPNILNIGYAESTDGTTWTRIDGSLLGAAVLRESGVPGTFDRDQTLVPNVTKDIATAEAPCAGVAAGVTCYRMWYEGARDSGGFQFFIGYATSPDGLNWIKVPGPETEGANLGVTSSPQFDASSVGISIVLKDGDLYRMWYEAKDFDNVYTIGHVVSVTGTNWVRPVPNVAVFGGADDPATPTPDNVWSHWVMKDGARYKMWYTTSTRGEPSSDRIAYASMVPGTPMAISRNAAASPTYSLTFTTTVSLPQEGYVLITLPPDVYSALITTTLGLAGFAAGATLVADDFAITDAAAANVTRGALLVRLTNPEPAGTKTITFTLSTPLSDEAIAVVQTFDSREVWEYGLIDLTSGTTAIQLRQAGTTTNNLVWPVAILISLSLITLVYWSRARLVRKDNVISEV